MKFLLLSLLPLAVDLAAARPAPQEESAALTRRSSPPPPADELQRSEESDKTFSDDISMFDEPAGLDYVSDLPVKFATDAANRFYNLGDEDLANLESFFTDDKDISVATRPGLKLPDGYDFSTAFFNDVEGSDVALFGPDGSVLDDATKVVSDKEDKTSDSKAFRPPFSVPDTPATFDPKATDIFDDKGLPTKVVFSPNDNYKVKIDLPAPATTPTPQTDYSQFLVTPSTPILQ